MFRDRPTLASELLRGPLHVALPDFDGLSAGELTGVVPTEYRADAVVTLTEHASTVLAVVIEVQLRVSDSPGAGEAEAVLAILDARGIEVPDHIRDEITNYQDYDRLDAWIMTLVGRLTL